MDVAANQRPVIVEVAVDSLAGARAAVAAGADRLELCQSLGEGGLTPSPGLLELVARHAGVPVFAMIRPRAGDFLYDADEFATMAADIRAAKAAGAAGIVGGILTADGHLDRDRLRELIELAAPLPFTCHRAFDLCVEPLATLATLRELGAARVLTSGQRRDALTGAATIARCVQAAGDRPIVMAGAGIRDHNAAAIVTATGVREVHLGAARVLPSAMRFRRDGVPMGSTPTGEFELRTTDGAMVARVVAALSGRRA
ncbi:MAG: copper homeostasis protein CutC [Planctomycetes bacterium]|nr:copper homeostasis protein CutC [Planctomycetota bacterium]